MSAPRLRPVERAVRKLADQGMPVHEIAWRFRRTPGFVTRVMELSDLRTPHNATTLERPQLRPVERCVLRARDAGVSAVEIASRLRRSPEYVRRIERFTDLKASGTPGS